MPKFSAVALFCDDVREEKSGQVTLVGILPDTVRLTEIPGVIPKIAIYIRINLPVELKPLPINFRAIHPDGEVINFSEVSVDIIAPAIKQAKKEKNLIVGVFNHIIASPFAVPCAGRFTIEVTRGDETITAGSLEFIRAPSASE